MKRFAFAVLTVCACLAPFAQAQNSSLTIYNQDFAVVRDRATLDLKEGDNQIAFSEIAATLEPQSVILRDPKGAAKLQILDQSFRNDPVTQGYLLSLFEGKTIQFQAIRPDGKIDVIEGKVIRSGYTPPQRPDRYGNFRPGFVGGGEPVIEVAGKLQFALPGMPLFPSLGDDTILKPTLNWTLRSSQAGKVDAEIGYLATGLSWQADYNIVSPETGDQCDIVGWVTFQNQSGKTFHDAKINLMAGDVSRVQENRREWAGRALAAPVMEKDAGEVTQKDFDEFKLYTLPRPVTLRNQEMKQVEFVKATNVQAPRFYVYDGALGEYGAHRWWLHGGVSTDPGYGSSSNKKVWIFREFENSEKNGLGIPLPKGKLRFYRRDTDGSLQFVGENVIDHTPKNEKVRVYLGNAFDLVGERKQTDFTVDSSRRMMTETFEITLKNRKKEAVEFRVVEHLYRGHNWEIKDASDKFEKMDARMIEFRVSVPADGEKKVTYKVVYTW
ncbi:hypothetical protein QQ056_06400 [Oscillatoria laete-virens NRMC-F 0139]|nr:hypothetical protein [Oscillatoria laete-virens]MDL5053175.1 hypothetical protein [Oscillatoria laete-virens NRMC-F 0139]